jgi:hypothetical protein
LNSTTDTSYLGNLADFDHHKKLFVRKMNHQFIGWEEDGEWAHAHFPEGWVQLLRMYYNQGTNLASFEVARKSPKMMSGDPGL